MYVRQLRANTRAAARISTANVEIIPMILNTFSQSIPLLIDYIWEAGHGYSAADDRSYESVCTVGGKKFVAGSKWQLAINRF